MAFIQGKRYSFVNAGSDGAELMNWFEDYLTGLKCPGAVEWPAIITNRHYEAMCLLAREHAHYEIELTRIAAGGK